MHYPKHYNQTNKQINIQTNKGGSTRLYVGTLFFSIIFLVYTVLVIILCL